MDLDPDACYRAIATRDARFDGRFFVGVHTTGVYCRPICPARKPRRENVSFFPSAAAAQDSGFRSCLRCRPECSPDLAVWRGTSNTVSRGLQLIAEGGLDDGAVDALAARLGVGERHLRRLFQQHLGASPLAVAQTRRVLFARQLIAQTRLPLADVALAAGFGSVRRFNGVFQALYGRPPRELRRAPDSKAGPDASAEIRLTLPYARPYDWTAMIGFLAARAIPGVERVDAQGRYHRSIALDGACGSVSITHREAAATLEATIRFPRVTALAAIVARLRRVFDLAADPLAIAAHLSADRTLAGLLARRPGLRVPGAWDGFELAVRAVLGQQISVSAAGTLAARLVALYGTPVGADMPDGITHVFPGPQQLSCADAQQLHMPAARAATLSALAAAVLANPRLLDPDQSLTGAIERLCSVRGIGEWTAQYIAMRALREPDAFPATDLGLLRAMRDRAGRRPTPAQLTAIAEAWRPWRAYAALHLWTLDSEAGQPTLNGHFAMGEHHVA